MACFETGISTKNINRFLHGNSHSISQKFWTLFSDILVYVFKNLGFLIDLPVPVPKGFEHDLCPTIF